MQMYPAASFVCDIFKCVFCNKDFLESTDTEGQQHGNKLVILGEPRDVGTFKKCN